MGFGPYDPNQFYETPPELIERLINPYATLNPSGQKRIEHTICDPMAGNGAILQHLYDHYHTEQDKMTAVEIDQNLARKINIGWLRPIVADFFTWAPTKQYTLWLMNPQFRNGAKALIATWEKAAPGAQIACILNKVDLTNPSNVHRQQLANLIREFDDGTEDVGQPFLKSRRPTDVQCVIVRLKKPEAPPVINWEEQEFEPARDDYTGYGIELFQAAVERNTAPIRRIVESYDETQDRISRLLDAEISLAHHAHGIGISIVPHYDKTLRAEIRRSYWNIIFRATNFGKRLTSKFVAEFRADNNKTAESEFTVENIMKLLNLYLANEERYVNEAIVSAFDIIKAYDKTNVEPGKGYVTNNGWLVGPKIILPYISTHDKDKFGSRWRDYVDSHHQDKLDDIDRALCYIMGIQFENITSTAMAIRFGLRELKNNRDLDHRTKEARWQSEFFEVQFYKCDTVHLRWLSEEVRTKFNLKVAQLKKWLQDEQYTGWQRPERKKPERKKKEDKIIEVNTVDELLAMLEDRLITEAQPVLL